MGISNVKGTLGKAPGGRYLRFSFDDTPLKACAGSRK